VLDEVDACPLDETNVAELAEMLKGMSGETQFLLVTHSKRMMTSADLIYGVTMQEPGVSKVVSVRLGGDDASRHREPHMSAGWRRRDNCTASYENRALTSRDQESPGSAGTAESSPARKCWVRSTNRRVPQGRLRFISHPCIGYSSYTLETGEIARVMASQCA